VIVVTGSCRTGTSLAMQTLKRLGVEVVGLKFHHDFSHKELNPNGYYELPIADTVNGIQDDRYKGKAVKLFGYQLSKTLPDVVDKVIVCVRDKDKAIASTQKLFEAEKDWTGIEPTDENCWNVYHYNYEFIMDWLIATNIPFISILYGCDNVNKIKDFIGG